MKPILGRLGPLTLYTYTVALDAAILIGLGVLVWQGKRRDNRPNAWLDVGIGGVVGGVIGGRLIHATLHWDYFSEHLIEIVEVWRGGLDWHGALLGGLAVMAVVSKLRDVSWRSLLDVTTFLLPLGVIAASAGCLMGRCAYGREVSTLADYPPLIAAELPDIYGVVAPRLATQAFGIALGLGLALTAWALATWIKQTGVRFWLVLFLLGLGMFGIGYLRGDAVAAVGELRIDQVLDLATAGLGVLMAVAMAVGGKDEAAEPEQQMPTGHHGTEEQQ